METEDDFDFELAEKLLEAVNNGDRDTAEKVRKSMSGIVDSEAASKRSDSSPYHDSAFVDFTFSSNMVVHSREISDYSTNNWLQNGTNLRGRVIQGERTSAGYRYYVESIVKGVGEFPPVNMVFRIMENDLKLSVDTSPINTGFANIHELQGEFRRKKEEEKKREEEEKRKKEEENRGKVVNDRIADIQSVAEEIHPGCWDFSELIREEFRAGNNAFYRLTIHFPEVRISNGRIHHDIKDLFVSTFFDGRMNHCSGWYGTRSTISYGEMRSSYRHSHLSTSSGPAYSGFCLGSGTETSMMVAGLQTDGWNLPLLRQSLILMYGYVAWESLEGGPYIKIQDINSGDQTVVVNPTDVDKNNAYSKFIDSMEVLPVQFISTDNIGSFVINEKDEEFETLVSLCTDVKVIKTVDGNYINRVTNTATMKRQIEDFNRRMTSSDYNNSSQRIRYKNAYLALKCIENIEENENSVLVAAPQITEFVARKLEGEINNYKLKMIANELS